MVVDGSNLATEGRNTPSLAQLDEAVQSFAAERPDDEIIVVVDASFGYRIDESERKIFEEAEEAGEIVSPPAGAIGRGDGFLLRIADRIGADVLSNDSFQEFHGEYLWLFEEGRLVGGKPVPNVGWIFTPRTPVRGPKSRVATRDADRARRKAAAVAATPSEPTAAAIAEATADAISPEPTKSARRGRRRRSGSGATVEAAVGHVPEAINEPLPFITFIADHPLGTEVEGVVEGFTSHGAFVIAGGARCYAPVSALGDPPPRSAKEVLTKGEARTFVIQALDPPRRGIELALPGLAKVAGAPTEETVEAEIDVGAQPVSDVTEGDVAPAKARRSRKKAAPAPVAVEEPAGAIEAPEPAAKPRRRKVAPVVVSEAETAAESEAEAPPAPTKSRRSRKAAPAPEVAPAPAPAPAPPAVPAEAEAPARPRRSTVRKAAAEPAPAEPVPVKKATRSRKKAAPEPVPVEEPVKKATRSRRRPAAEPAPVVVAVKKAAKRAAKAVKSQD